MCVCVCAIRERKEGGMRERGRWTVMKKALLVIVGTYDSNEYKRNYRKEQ